MKRSFRLKSALILALALSALVTALAAPAIAEFWPTMATTITSNARPIAENIELETYRSVSVSARFKAVDPDGDEVTFELVDMPKKGTVKVEEDGTFTYTPDSGKRGRDTFTYIACDPKGGLSNKATVTIEIRKQQTDITYSDIAGTGLEYPAVALAERGVFMGDAIAGRYFFRPAQTVTRGEFVAMCLALSGTETLKDIVRTGFYDDDKIPQWVKPYVSTALMNGLITGCKTEDGRLVFNANDPITVAQAAVILNNMLRPTDVSVSAFAEMTSLPSWAHQAGANLDACDILPSETADYNAYLTRAQAAEMLVRSMRLLDSRDDDRSILSWVQF